jgi:D-glycero-D-manno-heptose 1,7-bisphosphate phosphatase
MVMKAAFLDRDGVINRDLAYVHKVEDFHFTEGCIDALTQLQNKGFTLFIVTNQSGIGRGYYSEDEYQRLTEWYVNVLSDAGVSVAQVYHCPHSPEDECTCRKPKPGLFLQAARDYDIDFSASIMVGDKHSDMDAAKAAGIQQCYFVGETSVEYSVYNNLSDCINHIV